MLLKEGFIGVTGKTIVTVQGFGWFGILLKLNFSYQGDWEDGDPCGWVERVGVSL